MATGIKGLLTRFHLREDSLAVLEGGLKDAGLADADLASLNPAQLEKLRKVALDTEVADAISVAKDRLGGDFRPDERKILVKIFEGVVKRSGRLPELVKGLQTSRDEAQQAQVVALSQRVAAQNDTLQTLQGMLAQIQAVQAAQVELQKAQMQANPPAPAQPANANPPAPVAQPNPPAGA